MLLVTRPGGRAGSRTARSAGPAAAAAGAPHGWPVRRLPGISASRCAICRTSWRMRIRGCWRESSTTCSPTPCSTTAMPAAVEISGAEDASFGCGGGRYGGHHRERHGNGDPARRVRTRLRPVLSAGPVARLLGPAGAVSASRSAARCWPCSADQSVSPPPHTKARHSRSGCRAESPPRAASRSRSWTQQRHLERSLGVSPRMSL